MKFILILALLVALILAGPTNCNDHASGVVLDIEEGTVLDDAELLEELDTLETEECKDALVCKIPCQCKANGFALFKLDDTNIQQTSTYTAICTTTFADAYLKSITSIGDNFRIDLVRKFLDDNTFENKLRASGIKIPIAVTLKKALREYLYRTETTLLQTARTCCKPKYNSQTKLRTIFWIMSLKFFNSYARIKELCTKSGKNPSEVIDQVLNESIKGSMVDLLEFQHVLPVKDVKNLLLKVYQENQSNYCDCRDMIAYAKSTGVNTLAFENLLSNTCKC